MVSTTIYDCSAQLLGDEESYTIIFNSVEKLPQNVPIRTATVTSYKNGDIFLTLQANDSGESDKKSIKTEELPQVLHGVAHYLAYGEIIAF